MRKKEFLKGFYRTLGQGAALSLASAILIILSLLIGVEINTDFIKINQS